MFSMAEGVFMNDQNLKMNDFVKINLRGATFIFPKALPQRHPNTLLAKLHYPKLSATNNGQVIQIPEFYFDRNPSIFHQILDYYRTGKLHIPNNICAESVREELSFWGIPWSAVHQCCWKSFYQIDDDMDVLKKLAQQIPADDNKNGRGLEHETSRKAKLWSSLHGRRASLWAKLWRLLVILSVILSTFVYIIHGSQAFRVPRQNVPNYDKNTTETKLWIYLDTVLHPAIIALEIFCNIVLMLDWFLLLYSSPDKKLFFRSFLNVVDIAASLGVWATLVVDLNAQLYHYTAVRYLIPVLMALYTLRVFRVFRLVLNNSGMQILLLALRSSFTELLLLVLAFGSFSIMFAGLIFTFEFETGTSFTDMFISIWWAIITMTTVGYGDFYPNTAQGYTVGCLCALSGILLIAMPVAVTSSNFNDFFVFNKYRWRHSRSLSANPDQYNVCGGKMKKVANQISNITYIKNYSTQKRTVNFGDSSNKVSPIYTVRGSSSKTS